MDFIFWHTVSSRSCMPETRRLNEESRNHRQAINLRTDPPWREDGRVDHVSPSLSLKAQEPEADVQHPRAGEDGCLTSKRGS